MSDQGWWNGDAPDDYQEDDLGLDCDFGLTEYCVDPFARDTGCTINCGLYLQACEEMP